MSDLSTEPAEGKRLEGVVVNFLSRKGYGFIMGDDGVKVFVHYSDIRGKRYRTLVSDERVEFTCVQGPKGPRAVDVVRLNPPPESDVESNEGERRSW